MKDISFRTIRIIKTIAAVSAIAASISFPTLSQAQGADFLVIAHPDIRVETVPRAKIADIYQGKQRKWEGGETIHVAMLKSGPAHETFARDIVGLTPSKLKNIWMTIIFTGKGMPPKVFRFPADLVEYVADTRGAIGYIPRDAPHEAVNVLSVIP